MLQLSPTSLKQTGFGFNRYDVLVPAGTPFSALLVPEFWTNVGSRLRRFDIVRAAAEDGSFDAELTVTGDPLPEGKRDVLPVVKMRVLHYWDPACDEAQQDLTAPSAPAAAGTSFGVSWGGPHQKYRVTDPAGQVVAKDFAQKPEAEAWLATHLAERQAA